MDKFKIISEDPLNILGSTKQVVEDSQFVSIKEENLEAVANKVAERIEQGIEQAMGFKSVGNLADDVQRVFIEDSVNFCFWAGKGESKWQTKLPNGDLASGWFGFHSCFDRVVKENSYALDTEYISSISPEDTRNLFRSADGTEIPLLKKRINNLQEVGKILLEKFGGNFINLLEQADFNAIEIIKLIIYNFPSFKDISKIDGQEVIFLKRAQICSNDLNYVLKKEGKKIADLDKLTVFADYKLPQVLRVFGVLEYSPELTDKVDNYVELLHDSREEIEIRAATVWAGELIRQKIKLAANKIDNALWLLSQEIPETNPYHRTRTVFY